VASVDAGPIGIRGMRAHMSRSDRATRRHVGNAGIAAVPAQLSRAQYNAAFHRSALRHLLDQVGAGVDDGDDSAGEQDFSRDEVREASVPLPQVDVKALVAAPSAPPRPLAITEASTG
jgi:hypothetical protein